VHALAERRVSLDAADARDDRDPIAVGDAEPPFRPALIRITAIVTATRNAAGAP